MVLNEAAGGGFGVMVRDSPAETLRDSPAETLRDSPAETLRDRPSPPHRQPMVWISPSFEQIKIDGFRHAPNKPPTGTTVVID
ncbi:hypothetical protein VB712_07850 [Spirulina sp. CCNP1310]|uniref:hypothetical protein n=1 Tax=Spirulina sp. CCNP1310 TaxID=3110249 RepID=UPI002B209E47|nr:hypothetical protein [Spirulina sp. CCNP1310]MEA5419140.1 hypothetical protein [Spirulina sp. CCNP1310]